MWPSDLTKKLQLEIGKAMIAKVAPAVQAWPSSVRNHKKFDVRTDVRGPGSWGGPGFIAKTVVVAEAAAKKIAN
ncbi:MAG: hypothetical protein ACK5P6_09975 [Pseudobdellovibrionaceae bacterium]